MENINGIENIENIIAEIKEASILELNDLVKAIEEEFGNCSCSCSCCCRADAADAGAARFIRRWIDICRRHKKVGYQSIVREITGLGLKD